MTKEGTLIRQKILSSSPQIMPESPPPLNNQLLSAHYTHWPGEVSTGVWTELQNPLNSESESGMMEVTVEADYSSQSLSEVTPSFYPSQHVGAPKKGAGLWQFCLFPDLGKGPCTMRGSCPGLCPSPANKRGR